MSKNTQGNIVVKGARVNNLQNVDVEIPRNTLTVITGVSGSGKSSLAFDTLYAEGRRRYVESLNSYARQFMGKLAKPDVDKIEGLPPAIAIEQRVNTRNPRSTVGTSTEVYDYLRLLFARIGRVISPQTGKEVKRDTIEDALQAAVEHPAGTRLAIGAPVWLPPRRPVASHIEVLRQQGYTRFIKPENGEIIDFEDFKGENFDGYELLIDRLAVPEADDDDETSRLRDSIETAFFEGHDAMSLYIFPRGEEPVQRQVFSRGMEIAGVEMPEVTDTLFNFNNPYGACPRCEGFGRTLGYSEQLVVPNPSLSVFEDAIVCWRGEKMGLWKKACIEAAAAAGFPIHRPYEDLTPEQKDFLWHGNGRFGGLDAFFKMIEENQYKIQYRVMKARYQGKTVCNLCHGKRLRKEALYVRIADKSIADLAQMPVSELAQWFANLELDQRQALIADRLLKEIRSRLGYLVEVGLGYLTLDRLSSTLSGGESQRVGLATQLGSSLMGSLYILDEPSIGLHPHDTQRLIGVMRNLQKAGNTVVVVEHDEEVMRASDYLIDVGPDAGVNGGKIIYAGPTDKIADTATGHTADYLTGRETLPKPEVRRRWRDYIEVTGVRQHNLRSVTAKFPLGVMTAVTGVSGSGKSSLVRDVLYNALRRYLDEPADTPGTYKELRGSLDRLSSVEFVDQNPIGKSTRSNAVTYLKAYDDIRQIFAQQQAAKQMGLTPAFFSFNTDGGRCEECKGEGVITIEMQFMADITMQCEACHGHRFKDEVLMVKYRDKNIFDVLEMSVDQAVEFFGADPSPAAQKVTEKLQHLVDVGLGYIKLGQSSSTLSGGENQRVKLASYLSERHNRPTMFIFDEPTTGLHFHDIRRLLDAFNRLIDSGHTVVVIEHNVDVIRAADHVIDIGPGGGDAGGKIVATGTPEQVAKSKTSITAQYL